MRQQAQSFEEKDGTLYHVSDGVVMSKQEKEISMQACHDGIDGSHFGRDKTYLKV